MDSADTTPRAKSPYRNIVLINNGHNFVLLKWEYVCADGTIKPGIARYLSLAVDMVILMQKTGKIDITRIDISL